MSILVSQQQFIEQTTNEDIALIHNKFIDNIFVVYVMYHNDNILYVGRTKDLKRRLYNHFNTKPEEWKKDVTKIIYYPFNTYIDVCIIEIYLINTLRPKYNTSYNATYNETSRYIFQLPIPYTIDQINHPHIIKYCPIKESLMTRPIIKPELSDEHKLFITTIKDMVVNEGSAKKVTIRSLCHIPEGRFKKYLNNDQIIAELNHLNITHNRHNFLIKSGSCTKQKKIYKPIPKESLAYKVIMYLENAFKTKDIVTKKEIKQNLDITKSNWCKLKRHLRFKLWLKNNLITNTMYTFTTIKLDEIDNK